MKRTNHIKRYLSIGGLLAAAAGVAWAIRPQPVVATTAAVTRGALAATVSGEGRTRVRDLYVVAAPVDGQLERVAVHAGDAVEPDAAVAEIRPAASRPLDPRTRAEATATLSGAEAEVARAVAVEREARMALAHADSVLSTTRQLPSCPRARSTAKN